MRSSSIVARFVRLGCKVGAILAVTTVAVFLDVQLGTRPWMTITAIGIGVTLASALIVSSILATYAQLSPNKDVKKEDDI